VLSLAIVLLVVAHSLLLGAASRLHYSVLVAVGVLGIAVLKYGWWKRRR
jgi:hypothetical protein